MKWKSRLPVLAVLCTLHAAMNAFAGDDTVSPTGSILINNGAASASTTEVILNLSAIDTGGSGLASMRFRNNTVDPYSAWESYLETKSWTLTYGTGTKKVYVQFMDGAGNISDANPTAAGNQGYMDSIVLYDKFPPTGYILINNGAASTAFTAVTLNLSATDVGVSGLGSMRFRNSTAIPYSPWESYQTAKLWALASGNGTKKVYAQFKDRSGNISDANPTAAGTQGYSDAIVLDEEDWTVSGDLSDCEGCHGNPPHVGKDGNPGTADDAPIVMTYWSGSTAGQDGGHGDPGGAPALACVDCHDLDLPTEPNSAKHGTGTYNSIWNNTTRSSNTSHLKAEFFTEFPANGPGDWSVQVAFDNYCTWKCHDLNRNEVWELTEPAATMRHSQLHPELGELTTDDNRWSVEFGTHLTGPPFPSQPGDADRNVPVPIDVDLSTNAAEGKEYAPCSSCHDPHGTGISKPAGRSNKMLRFPGLELGNTTLCSQCHI